MLLARQENPNTVETMSLEERRERGRKLLDDMLGPEQAEQTLEHWQQISPAFGEYVTEFLSGEIWSRAGLDRRTKSLVTIAVTAAMARPRALELNIRMAVNNGATGQEIAETLLHIAPYAGFPACWEGLVLLDQVLAESDEDER